MASVARVARAWARVGKPWRRTPDHEKDTPLSVALRTGNAAIIELLKSKGALESLPNEVGS